jgi:uncharacterized protein (UPF0332 family)
MNKSKPQRVNASQVEHFLTDARKRTITAKKNLAIDAGTAYQIAYEAMIKGSLALMLSHGQRPRKQLGHHIVIIEFAKKNLAGGSPGIFALFDRMRRKRNEAFYDVAFISDTEAQEAVATADSFVRLLVADIKARVP